jgi:hypothetical protein
MWHPHLRSKRAPCKASVTACGLADFARSNRLHEDIESNRMLDGLLNHEVPEALAEPVTVVAASPLHCAIVARSCASSTGAPSVRTYF